MSGAEDILVGYFQLMNMNGAARVFLEGGRAGFYRELAKSRKTAVELATLCQTKLRPTELLLEALISLGVVFAADGGKFGLSPLGQMLANGSYRHLGNEYWAHLHSFLATDQPIVRMDDAAQSEAHYQAQAAVLGWMLTPAAEAAARLLRDRVPSNAIILDLGAGSAVWSLNLAKELPEASVTANDWPAVLEVAQETAENLGLSNRLTTISGDYHEVDLPTAQFDLVLLANITHLETQEGNRDLLARAKRALKPGGQVAIVDVMPGQPQGDLNRTLYTLGLALRTERGQVYSITELCAFLNEAAFEPPQFLPIETPPHVMGLLIASKAARQND